MKTRPLVTTTLVLALALLLAVAVGAAVLAPIAPGHVALAGGPAAADVTITRDVVEPGVLTVSVERPVTFANRARAAVHLQFVGDEGHHLFEISGRLSAVFHRPGRHAYVVHVGDRALPGAVDVQDDATTAARLPVCGRVSIKETCIDF
jgi:hypothetical protein